MQISESFVIKIIEKFSAGKIGELELDDGTSRLVLKKSSTGASGGQAAYGQADSGQSSGAPGAASSAEDAGVRADGSSSAREFITSPIVGTFYPSLSPDAPPLVRPGSKVKAGDTLCILEAMKMMNHMEAEFDCEILSVKAASGDLVEYGQTLFEVKRL
ncbi:MAG: acetyl-CoA carboxylase biotin carboxyl carrier protein [Treponema sp.]|jgi:acetyl-CoA carboxylase biotin carboxyl carrier protein|nr:acetyl-CoA carboxylase biotin carboxyl carrier protein [Treponema sp.]